MKVFTLQFSPPRISLFGDLLLRKRISASPEDSQVNVQLCVTGMASTTADTHEFVQTV